MLSQEIGEILGVEPGGVRAALFKARRILRERIPALHLRSCSGCRKIARVLAEFDQPIPPVRLRFQLIEANSFQDDDPAIAEVVQELRSLFRFDGYRLLGEALVTLAGGTMDHQEFTQRFLGTDENFQVASRVRMERPGTVRLDPITLRDGDYDMLLETSVYVSQGQTVVIGGAKARVGGRSFILTVRAESE